MKIFRILLGVVVMVVGVGLISKYVSAPATSSSSVNVPIDKVVENIGNSISNAIDKITEGVAPVKPITSKGGGGKSGGKGSSGSYEDISKSKNSSSGGLGGGFSDGKKDKNKDRSGGGAF